MSDQSVIKYDWRLKLDNYCWKANIESPTYNTFSDRRGKPQFPFVCNGSLALPLWRHL
ncbi:hypothetical protein AOCH_003985 [Aspergillus ochraceoroseus]|uniref:Uncharacterized protein n=1 Tax=Aspergillus ochraceoroseus TaxID=138278 RepID=A0A0F8WBM8_9EURO|nr:hypothetical protein AOCH_003985 [Aspergillus ochraceoroseus]